MQEVAQFVILSSEDNVSEKGTYNSCAFRSDMKCHEINEVIIKCSYQD